MRASTLVICVAVVVGTAGSGCGPQSRNNGRCSAGQTACAGNVFQTCVDGSFRDVQTCSQACSSELGCTFCEVGTATCSGDIASVCNDAGTAYEEQYCDPVQGLVCDPNAGGCVGACSQKALGTSYIGCDYYPTVTGNTAGTAFDFAVAIANTASSAATVTIDGGALAMTQSISVPPRSVVVQTLPWHTPLKLCDSPSTDGCGGFFGSSPVQPAALAAKGAYHLRSTVPVTVYQFNPLQYTKGGASSYSNDASLLLPTNVWRERYYAAAWGPLSGVGYPGLLAVTAMHDGTAVTLQTKANTQAGQGAPAFMADAPQMVMLNAGDVLEITSSTGDLTGSLVDASRPVQVISGHYCANVPDNVTACDHLEESMFPIDTLSTRYIVNAPAVTTIPQGKVQVVRVIATAPGTTLTYDPPQPGAPTTIAQAGQFVEIANTAASFMIEASQKVLVAQYMTGQSAGGGTGDPAMSLAVPIEQFRTQYLFHAPTNYETNYVDVTAPIGAQVLLDGTPLTFTPIGNTGYGLARVSPLGAGPGNDGNHSIEGNLSFGITVYGYGQYTSYWYPGGLDLNTIIF
jgi:hypothetical protein